MRHSVLGWNFTRGINRDFRRFVVEAAHRLPNVPNEHKRGRLHAHSFRIANHINGAVDNTSGSLRVFSELKVVLHRCMSDWIIIT